MRALVTIVLFMTIPLDAAQVQEYRPFHGTAAHLTVDAVQGSGSSTVVTISHPSGRRVMLTEPLGFEVQAVHLATPTRLVLRTLSYRWNEAAIVDPDSGDVVDQLMLDSAVVSPSGRRMALAPATPRWAEAMGALYLIYDVDLTPAQNRMSRAGALDALRSGWAVYPPENAARRTYEVPIFSYYDDSPKPTAADLQEMHHRASGYFWFGDHALAFVDRVDGQHFAVVADVSRGIQSPRTTTAPIPKGAIGADFRIERITSRRAGETLHLTLHVRRIDDARVSRTVEVAMPGEAYREN